MKKRVRFLCCKSDAKPLLCYLKRRRSHFLNLIKYLFISNILLKRLRLVLKFNSFIETVRLVLKFNSFRLLN